MKGFLSFFYFFGYTISYISTNYFHAPQPNNMAKNFRQVFIKGISESGGTSAIKGITITWAKR